MPAESWSRKENAAQSCGEGVNPPYTRMDAIKRRQRLHHPEAGDMELRYEGLLVTVTFERGPI